MNPNSSPLYAGIAGASLNIDIFDFGHGIVLKKTYAHIMAPYLAAFMPAQEGKHHPAPWKTVSGGMGFDIQAELDIPIDFSLPNWFDRINTIWWFAALIRLRASILASVPVIANKSFSEMASSEEEPYFWPIEMKPSRLTPTDNAGQTLNKADLEWIRKYWLLGGTLMNQNNRFNLAFQAIDGCIWNHSSTLALVSLWGALEYLFSSPQNELRFRISATIASYLEKPGEQRLILYQKIKNLYNARSKAAHGSPLEENNSLFETYALLKRILIKMIEENHIPSREELETLLFGAELAQNE